MTKKKTVIGFLGKARAGKDTANDFMTNYLSEKGILITHESFAKLLKEQATEIAYWDMTKDEGGRRLLQNFTKPIKEYGNWLAEKYPDNEFFSDFKNGAYYPAHTLRDIRTSDKDLFSITDFRFKSETELFNQKEDIELITIRIVRLNEDGTMYTGDLSPEALADISENDLNDYQTTYTIYNDGSLDEFKSKIERLANKIFANSFN